MLVSTRGRYALRIMMELAKYDRNRYIPLPLIAENQVNILDITQTIIQNIFTMVMLVDIQNSLKDLTGLTEALNQLGKTLGVEIRIQHEDIFNSMHRI